jgi:AAA domain-containing protein
MDERRDPPLTDTQAADVLRYWLGSMRYQEALAARPKAQKPEPPGGAEPGSVELTPNLVQPTPGRKYMKLDWAEREAFVSARRGRLELALDVEAKGLFEDWLASVYRRGEDDDDAVRVGYLLSFPAILLPKGELASLLRAPLELRWRTATGPFVVPSGAERATSKLPEPPVSVALAHGERESEDALPFFVDAKLLVDVLRVDGERLDAFFAGLRKPRSPRPRQVIDALTRLLEEQARDDGAPARPLANAPSRKGSARVLADLHAALARRLAQLGSRARAYPTALVVNADQSRVTAHAQRDIEAALERLEGKTLRRDAPLSRYLRGQVSEGDAPRSARCLGRFTRAGLTPHQLGALELALDRRLCAIQGPPGTGKTTLILNLAADALVRKVLPLAQGHMMSDAVLVVTSTNNAAVDNVTSPLGRLLDAERLPLALRVGSRDVTEKVTSQDLESCIGWLERRKEPSSAELAAALADVEQRHTALRLAAPDSGAALEALGYELFSSAERLREIWAARNRSNLLNVLTVAARSARTSRTLSAVLANTNKGGTWLRRLFPVFGSTLLSLGNVFPPESDCIERIVIDEAGQCHPGYAVSALVRAQSALVIGDVHQLEPVIGLSREDEQRMSRSLRLSIAADVLAPYRAHDEASSSAQHLADRAVATRPTLVDHFRCQPEIAAICERLCAYGLVVRTAPSSRASSAARLTAPLLAVALEGEQERFAGSWVNRDETREVVAWVQYLLACGISTDDIGVITPFRGQLEQLGHALSAARVPLADAQRAAEPANLDLFGGPSRGLALGTVHRFQGGERAIILLSTTLTRPSSLRFIDERVNLVNVAASRARDHLIVIGHEPTLLAGRHTRALLEGARRIPRQWAE